MSFDLSPSLVALTEGGLTPVPKPSKCDDRVAETHYHFILGSFDLLPSAKTGKAPTKLGVFDSGLGGLSVLRALQATMRCVDYLYVADSAFAPYGDHDALWVKERSLRITEFRIASGASGVAVACNTASAVALGALRENYPGARFVRIEPRMKLTVEASRKNGNGRIGVMATFATLSSERFDQLQQAQAKGSFVLRQPCPGLADLIEQGDLNAPAVVVAVRRFFEPLRQANVDTVALACTHYPLVAHYRQKALGHDVQLIDTAHAVARHAARHFGIASMRECAVAPPRVALLTTGDELHRATLEKIAGLYFPSTVSVQKTDLNHAV